MKILLFPIIGPIGVISCRIEARRNAIMTPVNADLDIEQCTEVHINIPEDNQKLTD